MGQSKFREEWRAFTELTSYAFKLNPALGKYKHAKPDMNITVGGEQEKN